MGTISGVQANISLFRDTYRKMTALGEAIKGQDYKMQIEGYPDLQYLVQTTTTPPLKREVVDTVGPYGVKSVQQGRFINELEMQISFKEVISGAAYQALRDWVKNKKYLEVILSLVSESNQSPVDAHNWVLDDCWIELDGADLSVEDAVVVKPAGTLHGNYFPE